MCEAHLEINVDGEARLGNSLRKGGTYKEHVKSKTQI